MLSSILLSSCCAAMRRLPSRGCAKEGLREDHYNGGSLQLPVLLHSVVHPAACPPLAVLWGMALRFAQLAQQSVDKAAQY